MSSFLVNGPILIQPASSSAYSYSSSSAYSSSSSSSAYSSSSSSSSSSLLCSVSKHFPHSSLLHLHTTAPPSKRFFTNYYSNPNPNPTLPDEHDNSQISDSLAEFKIQNLGNNSRRIFSRIHIDAPLHAVWNILTDYERLSRFIPSLALSQLLYKSANHARLFQVGQQNLAFGLKFKAKGIIDCYENELERLPFGKKRVIKFKMIEGDFHLFEGEWSIEQWDEGGKNLEDEEIRTTLSYSVDVKPKLWLPVQLVEGRLCDEIKVNLICIREEARKASQLPPK